MADLDSIHAYIARDNEGAADRVIARIRQATAILADFPLLGREGRVAGTRELSVSGLPYFLVYKVEPDVVRIGFIVHTARDYPNI